VLCILFVLRQLKKLLFFCNVHFYDYLVFARKLNILERLVRKRQVRGLRSAENQEFTVVSDWFSARA